MNINEQHILTSNEGPQIPYKASPNRGGALRADTLVIHFTAGRNAESSVSWLTNPKAKASAHVVIAENGAITQLVPFNVVAWHAGKSEWQGRQGLNQYSIGIELANPGNLVRTGSKWRSWFGAEVADDLVVVARHKHGGPEQGWKIFPSEQLDAALELAQLLAAKYALKEVVGHDDIAPGRKVDPGPAFPMERFRGLLLGRDDVAVLGGVA